ncbi:alpha-N-acetylgalactosaminide alpha-2,6-sialyltransferase 2 [Danio aesculapii]|uniref:alpha-N-acetylgalactosaminide alpha-2,6-sialyltransferase 2 n=1 Tax=Danio aesculapii TaxID=1142201 RepID=UPI0024C08315|nr:alpha-N-acetylgalactosaminide alpha-2,6-sialyltransferase 2 [Danio aesculapii]
MKRFYRAHFSRTMNLWLFRCFLAACVCFLYCFLQGLNSTGEGGIFHWTKMENKETWIVMDSAQEKSVPACSLRHIVNKTESLKKQFSFLVPVMQWRDSFGLSQWKKLQSEYLPYGWKNQSFAIIGNTLDLLTHPANGRVFERKSADACVRCAVVGNGGILNGSGQGKAIDSHDYVFRVNGAVIKGFERDVGSKTSFYGFTTNSIKNSFIAYQQDGFVSVPRDPGISYIFIPAETRDYVMLSAVARDVTVLSGVDKGSRATNIFGYSPEIQQLKMIHPSFIHYVTQRFLKSPWLVLFKDLYMPSTGAMMLMTALHSCDQVSAYGFITDNYKDFSDHYYDRVKKPLVFYANHDMEMEKNLWKKLHSQKALWLYQRETKK